MPWVRNNRPDPAGRPCELCEGRAAATYERRYVRGGVFWFIAGVCDGCAAADAVPKTYLDRLVSACPDDAELIADVREFVREG